MGIPSSPQLAQTKIFEGFFLEKFLISHAKTYGISDFLNQKPGLKVITLLKKKKAVVHCLL